jgi:hypothetical protein
MCVVSFIGDHYENKWKPYRTDPFGTSYTFTSTGVSQEEFDKLKEEVLEMKELLRKAKIYDEVNNEPNCEIEEKMQFLRQVAALVGVNLDEVFKPKT